MRRLLSTTIAAALVSASVPAMAQPSDEAFQRQVDTALEHYNARRYIEAAEAFQAAYEMRNDPELLYNAARSLERGLRRDEAIAMYERFLELPGSTADLRNRATGSVQALRAERDAATRPRGGGGTADLAGGEGGGTTGTPGDGRQRDDRRRGGGRSTTLEWVLVAGGGILVGVGSVFGITALSDNGDFEDSTDPAERRTLADDIDRNALLADVFIGAGIAAAGIGIILLIAGAGGDDEADESDRDTAFVPVFLHDGGGFQLRSRF